MRQHEIDPIEIAAILDSTPVALFRSLTSQTELRKWWAPRVIMSKHTVSFEEGKDIEMRLLKQEKNHMVRYKWRPDHWAASIPDTVITFEIEDLGVSREQTGEGVELTLIHDGWVDEDERNLQESIWKSAMGCLKSLVEGKRVKPWWDREKIRSGTRQVKLSVLKQFAERIEKDNRGKADKKAAAQNIQKLGQALDGQGVWMYHDNGNEIELRFGEFKIFGFLKGGYIMIPWRDLERFLGKSLKDIANRLTLEQDMDIHIGKSQDKITAESINTDLFAQWCIDVIQFARDADT